MTETKVTGALSFAGVTRDGEMEFDAQLQVRLPPGTSREDVTIAVIRGLSTNGTPIDDVHVLSKEGLLLLSGTPESGNRTGRVDVNLSKLQPVSSLREFSIFAFSVIVPPKRTGRQAQALFMRHGDDKIAVVNSIFTNPGAAAAMAPRQVVLNQQKVPRLVVGLNEAKPDPVKVPANVQGDPDTAFAHKIDGIAAIVHRVMARLDDPLGLLRAWEFDSAAHLPEFQVAPTIQGANELWARQVSEMLLGTSYGRPTNVYQFGIDHDYCMAHVQKGATNPYYGLSFACEHLASFGAASRGLATFPRPIEAGAQAAAAWVSASPPGKWFVKDAAPVEVPRSQAASGRPTSLTPVQHGQPGLDGLAKANVIRVSGLFKISQDDAEFGPGSVLLFSNRPAFPHDQAAFEAAAQSRSGSAPGACSVGSHERCVTNTKRGTRDIVGPYRVLTTEIETGRPLLADHTAGAHVGFVLRVSSDRKEIQTFDTGGFGVPGRNGGPLFPSSSAFHSGNFDDALTDEVRSAAAEPFRGVGVAARTTESEGNSIRDHVLKVLRKARPLGLARFALIEKGKKLSYPGAIKFREGWLKFLSPLVPMYQPDEEKNYHISRFLWSLREMPGKGVTGMWFLYGPRGRLAEVMMRGSARKKDLNTILADAEVAAERLGTVTIPIMNCANRDDGRVEILSNSYNNANSMHKLHFLEGRFGNPVRLRMDRAFLLDPDADLSSFPSYIVPPGTVVETGGG